MRDGSHPLVASILVGAAIMSGPTARAQFDPPALPNVYIDQILYTYRYDGTYLFPWNVGYQVVGVSARSSLYCEETDFSFLPLPISATAGGAAVGYGQIYQVSCDYISSLGGIYADPMDIYIPVHPGYPDTRAWLAAVAAGDDWALSAVLDPTSDTAPYGTYYEGGDPWFEVLDNTTQRTFAASDTFGLLSGGVRFGSAIARVQPNTGYLLESIDCGGGYELRNATLELEPGSGWNQEEIASSELGTVCVSLTLTNDGYDLDVDYVELPVERTVTGTVAGLAAKATFTLDEYGIHASRVVATLPVGHTLHNVREYTVDQTTAYLPVPRGTSYVEFDNLQPSTVGTLNALTSTRPLDRFLVARELPYAFRLDSLTLQPEGLAATATDARWLRSLPAHRYSDDDPARKGPRSNDVALSRIVGVNGIRIDGNGLVTSLDLDAGSGVTSYPRGTLTWGAGTVHIRRSQLANQAAALETFALDQRTGCPGCGSMGGGTRSLVLTRSGPAASTDREGTMVAEVTQSGAEIGFGPTIWPASGARPTFLRQGDVGQRGHLVLPGFVLPATSASGTAAAMLLGTWTTELAQDPTFGEVLVARKAFPLDDVQTRRGNGFFGGFNIGPEIYSDAQNQPVVGAGRDLAGTFMSIGFIGAGGAPDVRDIPANVGTKFVARGAVLGVFNVDAANAPQPQVYGYAFEFGRFAFGLVDNTLSPTTWIDGGVAVGGHADFRVPFVSLGLTCNGQLAGGVVDFARMGAERLRAWRTPFSISSLAFKPKPPDTECSTNPRELAVGGGIEVKSLDQPIQLEATWTPGGLPTGATLGSVQARLGKRAAGPNDQPPADPGFLVQTAANDLQLAYKASDVNTGWFVFGAKLMLPFWDALEVKLRLQNVADPANASANIAAPSLVVPKAFAPVAAWSAAWTTEGNAALLPMFAVSAAPGASQENQDIVQSLALTALKKWVFDIKGSIKWRPGSATTDQRFVAAIGDETDLKVVKVTSAVPYVTPTNTQLMFGMDADLRKIGDVAIPPIKIDLRDPDSLKRIDDFLARSPINLTGNPVQTGLGAVRDAINGLASKVKGLFGPALKGLLKTGIVEAFNAANVGDLLDFAAKAVSEIQSTAQKAVSAVFSPLRGLVDQAVAAIIGPADEQLRELYTLLPILIQNVTTAVDDQARKTAQDALDVANTVIGTAHSGLLQAKDFLVQLKGKVDQAKDALTTIKNELSGKATLALCLLRNPGMAPVLQNPGYLCTAQATGGRDLTATPGLINILDPSKLAYLSCDKDKNPLIKHVDDIRKQIHAVTDKLTGSGARAIEGMINIVTKPLGINADGALKTVYDVEALAKWIKEKVDVAYEKVAGNKPGSLCSKAVGGVGPKLAQLADKARNFLETVRGGLQTAAKKVNDALVDLLADYGPLASFKKKVDVVIGVVGNLVGSLGQIQAFVESYLKPPFPSEPIDASKTQAQMDTLAGFASILTPGQTLKWCADPSCAPDTGSFLGVVADRLADPVYELIGMVESKVGAELSAALSVLPFPKRDEILQHITTLIVDSPIIDDVIQLVTQNMSFIEDKANEVVNMLLDQLSHVLQAAFDKVQALLSSVLKSVTSVFGSFPIQAASIKGFADIMGNQLMALQVDAHFTMNKNDEPANKDKEKASNSFDAMLRVESWLNNGKAQACGNGSDASNKFDVTIGASNLPIKIGGSDGLGISKLHLGFTIDNAIPRGVFGGITTTGSLKLGTFQLRNIAFTAAAGLDEVYVGARAQAIFESFNCEVAFFVGRSCNFAPLKALDPETVRFIKEPASGEFFGAYVHGSVVVPLFSAGCMLKLTLGAEAAIWAFKSGQDFTLGGLVGGSIAGKALCFVAIKGGIRVAVNYTSADDKVSGTGEFFAGGGIGFSCDEDTWTSSAAIRADGGCATVDVSASATFAPMSTGPVSTSGID